MDAYKNKNKLGLIGCHFPWEKMTNVINEYTHLDPTLPRVKFNMVCPNAECPSNITGNDESKDGDDAKGKVPKEIIYLRYNDSSMKYVYLCGVCKTHWKTDK